MRRGSVLAAAALLASAACNGGGSNDCAPGSPSRCANNAVEACTKNWFTGEYSYTQIEICHAPQVCRAYTAGAGVEVLGATGCFDPNAYCPSVGWAACDQGRTVNGAPVDLYVCALRASDQTLRWSVTDCSQLVPAALCSGGGDPQASSAACYEVVQNCVPQSWRCSGADRQYCSYTVAEKAVWDWTTIPCDPAGTVCRENPGGTVSCVSP